MRQGLLKVSTPAKCPPSNTSPPVTPGMGPPPPTLALTGSPYSMKLGKKENITRNSILAFSSFQTAAEGLWGNTQVFSSQNTKLRRACDGTSILNG